MLRFILASLFVLTSSAEANEPVLTWRSGAVAWTGAFGFYPSGEVLWHNGLLFHESGELAYDMRRGVGLDPQGQPIILDGVCILTGRRADQTCRVDITRQVQLRLVQVHGLMCPVLSLGTHEVQPSCEGAFTAKPPEAAGKRP